MLEFIESYNGLFFAFLGAALASEDIVFYKGDTLTHS